MFGFKAKKQPTIQDKVANLQNDRARHIGLAMPTPSSAAQGDKVATPKQAVSTKYYVIEQLPEGTIIKKIFTRNSKDQNKWRVGYHGRKTVYYGHTLEEALQAFFKNNPKFQERYTANLLANG